MTIALGAAVASHAADNRTEGERKADEAYQNILETARLAKQSKQAKDEAEQRDKQEEYEAEQRDEQAKHDAEDEAVRREKVEKYEAEQREKEEKHEEEQREQRKRLYNDEPKAFFVKYIENKMVITEDGISDEPQVLTGHVIQIPIQGLLIVEESDFFNNRTDRWVALEGFDTTDLVDDDEVKFAVKSSGTYRYTTVSGAVKTIRRFVPSTKLTYKDFENLKSKGVDVLEAVEGLLKKGLTGK